MNRHLEKLSLAEADFVCFLSDGSEASDEIYNFTVCNAMHLFFFIQFRFSHYAFFLNILVLFSFYRSILVRDSYFQDLALGICNITSPFGPSFSGADRILYCIHQVYGEDEWSFGFCERGTGVFSCPSGKNPIYSYRECIVLGRTDFSIYKVNQILRELSREWPGSTYDLLARNCNHFCDEFCERLGVQKPPGLASFLLFLSCRSFLIEILLRPIF